MSTIAELKTNHNTIIRTEAAPGGITPDDVADQLDNITDELLARGIKVVADTAALSALSGADFLHAIVTGNGVFKWLSTGTPNGTTIFAATGGGVYSKVLDVTGADPTAINNLTSGLNDLELGGAPIQPSFPSTTAGSTIAWAALNDPSHQKLQYAGVNGVTDGGYCEVNYDATKEKAVTFIAAPDEQCAKALLFMGASVGVTKANIYIYRPQVYGGELTGNGTTGWNKSSRIADLDLSISGSVIRFNLPDAVYPTPIDYEGVSVHFQSSDNTRYGYSIVRKVSGLGAYFYGFEIYDRSGVALTTFPTTDKIIINTPCLKSIQVRADVIDSNGANNFNYKVLSNNGGGGLNFWAISVMKK